MQKEVVRYAEDHVTIHARDVKILTYGVFVSMHINSYLSHMAVESDTSPGAIYLVIQDFL